MVDTCATCFFFNTQTVIADDGISRDLNVCRRQAPTFSRTGISRAIWPAVQSDDWCGDWALGYPTNIVWQTYTPTIAANSGSLTATALTYAVYAVLGKLACVRISFTITTNGTAAGYLLIALPSLNNRGGAVSGYLNTAGGAFAGLIGRVSGGNFHLWKYDGTYPGADGTVIEAELFYEIP